MGKSTRVAVLALLVTATGCGATRKPGVDATGAYRLTDAEQSLMARRLGAATQPRLSLGMSGGGIRSALFNFGVLKALYDDGVLSKADIVSSVSGGSYLNYWLYTEQLQNLDKPFGYSLFHDSQFPARLCEFTVRSNFVPFKYMAWRLPQRLWNTEALRGLYDERFRLTFGSADSDSALTITDLKQVVEAGHPYPIFNASTYGSMPGAESWPQRVFELTPIHYGNLLTRTAWEAPGAPPRTWDLSTAALASGAALSMLKRRFDAPLQGIEKTHLWDGGKTENLGAVAPLVRGTGKLIIVDAQMDPSEGEFSAIDNLQRRMHELGTELSLDRSGDPAVYPGVATTAPSLESRLYYVKMKIPQSLRDTINREFRSGLAGESELPPPYVEAYEQFLAVRGKSDGERWECEGSRGRGMDVEKLMLVSTAAYISYAEGGGLYRRLLRWEPPLFGSAITHKFPRTATVDQSMYLDQALAYVGLGYLNARGEVKALMEGQKTP